MPDQQGPLQSNDEAQAVQTCDHLWMSRIRNGQSLRSCMNCGEPHWDDVLPALPFWHCSRGWFGSPTTLTTRAKNRREAARRYRNWMESQHYGAPRIVIVRRAFRGE